MKRFIIGFLAALGGILVVALIGILLLIKSATPSPRDLPENSVLYIHFKGNLTEYQAPLQLPFALPMQRHSLKQVIDAIDAASKDPKIVGIIARLDHAYMGTAQAQELRNAIIRFRATSYDDGKFAIAHADTFGELRPGTIIYYLASAFSEIHMQPLGTLGLTGLAIEVPFAGEIAETLELKPQLYQREEYKSVLESLTKKGMTAPNREALQHVLDSQMDQIIHDIAVSREISESEVRNAVDRGPLLGDEAVKLGLIDRISYVDEIRTQLSEKTGSEIKMVTPTRYNRLNPPIQPEKGRAKIALIYGIGAIHRDSDGKFDLLDSVSMGSNQLSHAFQTAIDDKDVKAIVFRINSGGGSAIASETIWRATIRAQEAGKPVIVSMSDLAGSGGYWIASHADKIIAHPGTITGSIGAVAGKIVTQELWKKIGINWDSVHSGENAMMWSTSQEYSEHGRKKLKAWVDQLYETFLKRVAEGRKLSLEHVRQIAKGRIWSGADALKYGLVDQLGGLDTAIEVAKAQIGLAEVEVPIVVFPKDAQLHQRLLQFLAEEGDEGMFNPGLASQMPFGELMYSWLQSVASAVKTFVQIHLLQGELGVVKIE